MGYSVLQRDPEGGDYWFLHPGEDEEDALETCPIAVGFVDELNNASDREIKSFLTGKNKNQDNKQDIYQHYISRTDIVNKPVMYLLLPTQENAGRVPLILPAEGELRQRQIQTFAWDDGELIARLNRLQQGELPIAESPACLVPQVDYVFYPATKTSAELARELATAAREIERVISQAFNNKTANVPGQKILSGNFAANSYLQKLLASFQKELLPTLQPTSDNEKDYSFADIYAQTIAYALFTARVFSYVTDKRENTFTHFDRESAWKRLPETNPFLRKLFEDISQQKPEDLGDELIAAINDIFGILRAAKMDAILSDFQLKMNREDIVIRFYEDFLAAYKSDMRECRGVYFTPEPVVSYIVRSVDALLKRDFGLPDGIADASKVKIEDSKDFKNSNNSDNQNTKEVHKVLITDIATGTGTFLFSIIDHIFNSLKLDSEQWSKYVSENLLPRLLGFELLMAPYAVAHLKLGLQLAELGYKFDSNERLRVYLTNTLQEAFQIPPADGFENLIRDEADAANIIKQQAPVMVVMGNPPYSGHSANKGDWIGNLLKGVDTVTNQKTSNYFEVDGKPLGERNPKWLNDDYVKFIRFGQWRIEQTGYGILAFITNHGYLDNPTFRGMRQSLMETFDDIYVLDLHGNSKKKEQSPDGSKDENVFDIQQGVAISIFVKRQNGKKQPANVYHADLYGLRDSKYQWLKENDITATQWQKLQPQAPFYLFVPQNTDLLGEYERGWKVTDIFPINSVGIVTGQDAKTIAFTKNQAEVLADSHKLEKNTVTNILYRPLDQRFIVYDSQVVTRPRNEVMQHMLGGENLGLITSRMTKGEIFQHAQVTNKIVEVICMSPKTSNNGFVFPLYLYPNPNKPKQLQQEKRPNLSPKFLKDITKKLGYTPEPEAIFYYIYAIFHSPTYRKRYAEFLKIDFPRVPLTSDKKLFTKLSEYGEELVALHLMKSSKLDKITTKFIENNGNFIVDPGHPKYQDNAVIINKKGDKFINIPESVWNFYVGGYQVCHKWLKDRKGRTLTNEDIQHYQKIVVALATTIEIMDKIDKAIPGFPIK